MAIRLIDKYASSFVTENEYAAIQPMVVAAHEMLHAKAGLGNDYLGWLDLPRDYDKAEYARIKAAAAKIKKTCAARKPIMFMAAGFRSMSAV